MFTEDVESNKHTKFNPQEGQTSGFTTVAGFKVINGKQSVTQENSVKPSSFKYKLVPDLGRPMGSSPIHEDGEIVVGGYTEMSHPDSQRIVELKAQIEKLEIELEGGMEEREKLNQQIKRTNKQCFPSWENSFKEVGLKFKEVFEERQKEAQMLEKEAEKVRKEVDLLEMELKYADSQIDHLTSTLNILKKDVKSG